MYASSGQDKRHSESPTVSDSSRVVVWAIPGNFWSCTSVMVELIRPRGFDRSGSSSWDAFLSSGETFSIERNIFVKPMILRFEWHHGCTQKTKNFKNSQNQQKCKGASKDYYRTHGPNCGYFIVVGIFYSHCNSFSRLKISKIDNLSFFQ